MKLFKHFGVLSFFLLFSILSFSQSTLNGKVSDKKGNPVPFAIAFLKGAKVGTFTDTLGNFSLTTNAAGSDTILITCIGFDEIFRGITLENKTYPLVFILKEPYTTIGEVVITAGLIEANDERSVAVLKPLDIVTTAGGQGDIVGAIQTLPGVQRNGGDQTGLMVRGGDVSESAMIIDGMIAQNAFNSNVPGVSQRSRFNPFQFKGTSFSSGGYTARYGQALSGILDLQTNDLPSKSDVNFGANLAGISLSGSKLMGKNAVEYAGSMQHLAPYFAINPSNVNFYTAPQGGSFSTRFISKLDGNRGIFKMNFSQSYTKSGIQIPDPTTAGAKVNFDLANENTYFNTSLKYKASEKLKYYTAFSFSNNTDNIAMGMFDIYRADGRVQARAEMNYEFHRKFNLLAGTELQRISYTLKYDTLVGGYQETMSAAYLEGEYKVTSKFGIKPGIRAEYSQLLARANGSPRVALHTRRERIVRFHLREECFIKRHHHSI